MIKLTEDDFDLRVVEFDSGIYLDTSMNSQEEATELAKQILDDYEKARKYDERIRGLPVPEECNIYNGMTLKILLEKARKWDSWPEVREILRNQKLRERIEKRIEYFEFLHKQPTSKIALTEIDYESIELRKKELEKLLQESKK